MAKASLSKLKNARVNEGYLYDTRGWRIESTLDWKDRLEELDLLYRGEWSVRFPGESAVIEDPAVMNLVQVGLDDIARLCSETLPTVRVEPMGDRDDQIRAANVKESILRTYWSKSKGDLLVPKLAMDLAGAGGAFVVVSWFEGEYPTLHRVDPRLAYPDIYNGQLQDLLVIRTVRVRQAARMFPDAFDSVEADKADSVEIYEYYSPEECVQGIGLIKDDRVLGGSEGIRILNRYEPDLDGRLPVAFVQMDSYDGHLRGMFDQVAGSLNAKNRIVKLVLDYTDQMTYAQPVFKGVLNEEAYGDPSKPLRLDPNVDQAMAGRLGPAGANPQLYNLLEWLDTQQRGGASYPAQRQGEVTQSIASAAFVASTMGQLTTSVRNIQRLLGVLREDLNELCLMVDEKYLDSEKAMINAVGKKHTYVPSSAISGVYENTVVYGAGAGLDRLNADVRVLQHHGAGLISRSTAREQIDYLADPAEEQDKIEKEAASSALLQKFLGEAPYQVVMDIYDLMANEGLSMAAAVRKFNESMKQEEAGPTEDMAGPLPQGGPPNAEAQQRALQKGGVPGQAPELDSKNLQLEPLTQVLVKQPGA